MSKLKQASTEHRAVVLVHRTGISKSAVSSRLKAALIALAAVLVSGCANFGYYTQAVGGHLDLLRAKRPINEIVEDKTTDPGLRKKLEQVNAIREFAIRELALPDNNSYRSYADLGRPFAVWNVFAAREFSVDNEQWCMPIVGCVSYRGFYDRKEADQLARALRAEGLDTYVGGVPAYSTLGYFDDPVLNTFLRFGDTEVARLIFHELSHQVVFAEGDTVFNESFATAVENEGMRRWLEKAGKPEVQRGFAARQRRKTEFAELVLGYRVKLRAAYAKPSAEVEKRQAKSELIAEMRLAYSDLKAGWGGYAGFDAWFETDLNNAKMATLGLYTQQLPAFEVLLEEEGRDFQRFYARAAALAEMPKDQRKAELARLTTASRIALANAPASSPTPLARGEGVAVAMSNDSPQRE